MTIRLIRQLVVLAFALTLAVFVGTRVYTATQLDRTPPVITCDNQVVEVSVNHTDAQLLAGVSAVDDRDGDISDSILVKSVSQLITANTAKVTYIAIDSADNLSTLSRTVRYTDYEKPRFSLTRPLVFQAGGQVRVLGRLTATDLVDGNISDAIRVTSQNVDTLTPGTYDITVQVANSLGDMESLTLPLVLTADAPKQTVTLSEYIVYLHAGEAFDPAAYITAADSAAVQVEHAVDVNTPGTYRVSYTLDSAAVYQTVVVR